MKIDLKKLGAAFWAKKISLRKAVLFLVAYAFLLVIAGFGFYKYFLVPYEVRPALDRNLQESRERVSAKAKDAEARVNLGWALYQKYLETKQADYLEQAVQEYEQALQLDGSNVAAKYNLALVYKETNKTAEAQFLLREIVVLYPRHNLAHYLLGGLYASQDKLEEAILEFRTALAVAPGSANIYSELGLVLERQGLFEQAREAYGQALRYDPAEKTALERQPKLPAPKASQVKQPVSGGTAGGKK